MALGYILAQKFVEWLRRGEWTSASPNKTNYVKDVNIGGLDSSFDQALQTQVIEIIEEYNKVVNDTESLTEDIVDSGQKTDKKAKGKLQQQLASDAGT